MRREGQLQEGQNLIMVIAKMAGPGRTQGLNLITQTNTSIEEIYQYYSSRKLCERRKFSKLLKASNLMPGNLNR